ncbi:PH domain-containing protein [Winogradskyella litorisediminis]|uniref:PH domain-containing protein n=1 Tax=Winogradskyella litorisediminis TaxID=1156618 RepID=A0ABW3N5H3_9FLAO
MFSNSQIDIDSLPKFQDVQLQPISSKYIYILFFNLIFTYGIVLITLISIKYIFNQNFLGNYFWFAIAGILLLIGIQAIFMYLNFKTRKYGLREKDIIYSAGFITNKTTTLPFNRVQHIEISRSFLSRKLGLSTLKIYSAGESGGDISIAGLPKSVAENKYAFLIDILNERV